MEGELEGMGKGYREISGLDGGGGWEMENVVIQQKGFAVGPGKATLSLESKYVSYTAIRNRDA